MLNSLKPDILHNTSIVHIKFVSDKFWLTIMVGVSNLTNYIESKDKYLSRVGDWAVQAGKGKGTCRFCNITVSYSSGKKDLLQHSESKKHIKAEEEFGVQS